MQGTGYGPAMESIQRYLDGNVTGNDRMGSLQHEALSSRGTNCLNVRSLVRCHRA